MTLWNIRDTEKHSRAAQNLSTGCMRLACQCLDHATLC